MGMNGHAPLDQLFSAPVDAFVATRDRLVAELARAGKKTESLALKKVRRPSPSAWATNQVVRQARPAVDEFLRASDRLRRSQDALVDGRGDQKKYQEGVEALRQVTAALTKATREVLDGVGRGDDRHLVDRVVANLRAAALVAERRPEVLAARLTTDVEAGQDLFGGMLGTGAASSLAQPAMPKAGELDKRQQAKTRHAEDARLLSAARQEESTARQAVARAAGIATRARTIRDEAADRAKDAERAVATARQTLRAAEADLRQAEHALARDEKQAQSATRRRETLERSG
jgi:hypothetical protein